MPLLLSLHAYSDWGLLAVRIALAAIFWLHGTRKLASWKQSSGGMNGMMRLLSICEPLGAVAVLLGLLTQAAALGFCLVMLGAIYFKITAWKTPFYANDKNGWEFDLINLAASLMLVLAGAGALSLDRIFLHL